MPILNDIRDHEVIGRDIRDAMADGERTIILRQTGKRFGPVPAWARERIEAFAAPELERLALRVWEARSLEELPG